MKLTPWTFTNIPVSHVFYSVFRPIPALPCIVGRECQAIVGLHQTESTYALVEVDRVFAGDDVSDGAAGSLSGRLLAALLSDVGHF